MFIARSIFCFYLCKRKDTLERGKNQGGDEKKMKERILQIMRKENMTQQEFAKAIEMSPASLSNIFNGKTNPTINHVSAIHRRFPEINMNWMMFGEGDMYETAPDGSKASADGDKSTVKDKAGQAAGDGSEPVLPFDASNPEDYATWPHLEDISDSDMKKPHIPIVREVVKYIDKPRAKITEIRIFFDDGTYQVFS